MKKLLALLVSIVLVMSLFTGCSKEEKVKTGLAVITTADEEHSTDATADADGLAQADSTAVAVLVDDKGVIRNCVIDVIQNKINFNAAGEVTTDLSQTFVSKNELKEGYNMKSSSPIGKEWYEQAQALADYVTGKKVEDVKAISIEEGKITDEDLVSSVTITASELVDAIIKAVNNAQDLGASADDKLGLGMISALGSKTVNAGDTDGIAQAYTHYGVVTLNKDGKITSSIIDASQANITFSKEGKLTFDMASEIKTKNELGDAYSMRSSSSIGKEWNEQAKAFADYIVGKTADEVSNIAIGEDGKTTQEDLLSSVTVTMSEFVTVIEKAAATAK